MDRAKQTLAAFATAPVNSQKSVTLEVKAIKTRGNIGTHFRDFPRINMGRFRDRADLREAVLNAFESGISKFEVNIEGNGLGVIPFHDGVYTSMGSFGQDVVASILQQLPWPVSIFPSFEHLLELVMGNLVTNKELVEAIFIFGDEPSRVFNPKDEDGEFVFSAHTAILPALQAAEAQGRILWFSRGLDRNSKWATTFNFWLARHGIAPMSFPKVADIRSVWRSGALLERAVEESKSHGKNLGVSVLWSTLLSATTRVRQVEQLQRNILAAQALKVAETEIAEEALRKLDSL